MPAPTEHYVDNEKFLRALINYRHKCKLAKKHKRSKPRTPEYLGECFLNIANGLSTKPNFINYTFREDMVADGVENCLVYMHNFNPQKSKNPFGYFTSIIYYAFVRRIQRERKHTYLRYKLIEDAVNHGDTRTLTDSSGHYHVDGSLLSYENVQEFIQKYDDYRSRRQQTRRAAEPTVGVFDA
jgi:hypothetical protein